MTQINPEHLSAGMDGELSREELRFLLRRLDHDQQLLAQWDRFHLAGDGQRHELPTIASPDFAARVMQMIEQEQPVRGSRARPGWLRLSAGGAIAASVAVVALMATRPAGDGDPAAVGVTPTALAQTGASSRASSTAIPSTPAAAPAWLNSAVNPLSLSQQASATLNGPILGPAQPDSMSPYQRSLSPYQVKGYRTLQSGDGSYLLLVDPTRQSARRDALGAASAQ
jgi:sigma-E factor negative regulatory protein RseA